MSLPPVECIYVTEDCIREWRNGDTSFKVSNPVPMLRFLYEFCWTMVRGELPFQKCKAALESVAFLDSDGEMDSNFADIITQMAQDLTMPGEYRARLIKLAKWLVESAVVPLRFFQERCEEEFLWESEMIKIKATDLKSKEVRVNTRLLYQQTKFNLLREESEGYAKLVTLLCRGFEDPSHNASAATVGIIKSLIGHFDLDPNRVFDIVLECFELQPDNDVFLDLIPIFPKSHASQILGFKFQYYQRMEVNCPVPSGLYQLTALLVKKNFIDLDSIYAHLLPKDEEAFEHYNAFSAKRFDEANKIGKINLAATGKDLMDDEKQGGDVTVDLFTALDLETEAAAERSSELESNQILGLLTGFLAVDDWYHARVLFDRLSPLNPVEHLQICNGLFRLIGKSISSAYELVHQTELQDFGVPLGAAADSIEKTNMSVNRSFIDLPKDLFEMLTFVGPYLYRDTVLLQKVCRVLRGYYLSALEIVRSGGEAFNSEKVPSGNRNRLREVRLRIEEALGTCLLPSLQLIPANPAVCQEIWEVMILLPYEVRYRLYGDWEKDDERIPMLLVARQTAKLDTRRILKRLAKENLKQLGRMVAKLAHANPMTVLRTIVHQIEAYRDMITPVVDAFKYLTQLEYDILEFVVIERLAQGGREKLKDDGLNLSDWLQSLASFWGHLCKKYPSMELRGLFQYLVNQLKRGSGIELVLLQELIQQMANVQYTENMTEDQLDAMAGSETLRYQATSFGVTRNNKALIKSTNRLRDALLSKEEPKLAIPLLLLLAQHRSLVVMNADAPYIKMVSEQFDRCHGTLLQYVEFLCSAVAPTSAYAQMIPPLDELVHLYHLDPEVAFLIYRPAMRLFRCQNTSDAFWPLDCNEANTSAAEMEADSVDSSNKLILDLGSPRKPIMWSDLLDTVRTMLPPKAWNSLSPDLYATFWGLTLYDLYVPKSRYDSEIAKQHSALKALEELSDNSSSAITKRKKDKEKIQESLDRLASELQKHEEHVASVHRRLAREKDTWLSSCPDTLKINMEFLQRCIFPRCTFSMPDAVYCAVFVHTLHSLGTPFFNTVNHIDVLICKTLQPMICCCTEYEAGRLGRFFYETLKTAYYWKSDESIYERECGNMPGFAVYYRYPNSQRVNYGQFIKVHWKWSQRITRLLIQCLESNEYMEIRNALIVLTKISGVFPVTRKSGINLEKRVAKIKSDEREDLKVLATGVAAALSARKPSWVTEEEFGMGYIEIKPALPVASKSSTGNLTAVQNGSVLNVSQAGGGRSGASGTQHTDSANPTKDPSVRTKPVDGRMDRTEGASQKSEAVHAKVKGGPSVNGSEAQSSLPSAALRSGASKSAENQKQIDESANRAPEETTGKAYGKVSSEQEGRTAVKRSVPSGSLSKQPKEEASKDDIKPGKVSGNGNSFPASGKALAPSSRPSDTNSGEQKAEIGVSKPSEVRASSIKDEGVETLDVQKHPSSSRPLHSPRHENSLSSLKPVDKQQKRASPAEDLDRLNKRRKGEIDSKDLDGDARFIEPRVTDKLQLVDSDKPGSDEHVMTRAMDRPADRLKEKGSERYDRDYKERSRGDDILSEKRDRSVERQRRSDLSVQIRVPAMMQPATTMVPPPMTPSQYQQQQQWMMMNQPPRPQQQPPVPQQQFQPQAQAPAAYFYQQPSPQPHQLPQYAVATPVPPTSTDEIRSLWIGDLQYWMDEQYIISCFGQTGEVVSVKVIRNRQTGQSEGYGFIEFVSHAAAERNLQTYNNTLMPNVEQTFRLNWASSGSGEKHTDDTPDFTIFVGDLAADVTDDMLLGTFSPLYPSVKSAKVVIDRLTGHSKGYGFVKFSDEVEQLRAMSEMNGRFCSSRPMRIGPAANKKNVSSQQPKASYQSSHGTQNEDNPNNTTIFVGGLDSSVTDEHLKQIFGQYGQINHVKIPVGKRCGFVQFADRSSAEEALRMLNGTQLGGQSVRLSWGRSPSNKQTVDPNQWSGGGGGGGGGGYYGYSSGYEAYGYGQAAQDPNLYYGGGYPGYGSYQQAPPQQ